MKRLLALFIVTLAVVGTVVYTDPSYKQKVIKSFSYSQCNTPAQYKIGTIDPKFGLTQTQVLADVKTATDIWSSVYGKSLFVYDKSAKLTINFVYDQRTSLNTTISQLQNQLSQKNQTYQQQVDEYKAEVEVFNQKLTTYNATVEMWNQKGGAPPNVYNELVSEQKQLQAEANSLNAQANQLNLATKNYNIEVEKLNQDITKFNADIKVKPEEGLYDPNNSTVTIYFAENYDELIHTIAHEFGHVLGMQHVNDSNAIMNPVTSSFIIPTKEDKEQLDISCSEFSIFKHWAEELDEWLINTVAPIINQFAR